MNVIGITGTAGSGKDTLANFIFRRDPFMIKHDYFSKTLKEMLCVFLQVDLKELDRLKRADGGYVRSLMTSLGTEWARDIVHPDTWIINMRRKLQYYKESGMTAVIITDVRFPNEAEFILNEQEGFVVGIERKHQEDGANPNHETERHVSNIIDTSCRYTIKNNGTLEDLEKKADYLFPYVTGDAS